MNRMSDASLLAERAMLDKLEPVDVPKPAPEDQQFFSVTTIIGALDKPALVPWAAGMTADAAIAISASIQQRLKEDGPEEVKRFLTGARYRRAAGARSATELGTAVHAAAEEFALTGIKPEVDDEVRPFLDQFDKWLQVWQPVYESVEMTVFSPEWGYAGTTDLIATFDGMRLIGDYKSTAKAKDAKGKPTGPYPEVALQLSAYANAELAAVWKPRKFEKFSRRTYLLGPDEREMAVPVPKVDGGVVIHITPAACVAYPVAIGEQVFDTFLYCLECFRWQSGLSKTVIGPPLVKGVVA